MNFKSYFAENINNYINLKLKTNRKFNTEIRELKRFDEFLQEENITFINNEIIDKWVNKNKNWSINTKARNINIIKNFCIYLKNNNIQNYTFNKKGYKPKRRFKPYIFSHEEIKKIVYYADNYYSRHYFQMKYIMSFLIRLLYGTGMRLGETLNILKENIDIDNGIIKLINTKNNEERLIVLTDDLIIHLKNYLKKMNENSKYLFYNYSKNKLVHSTIENAFYKILKKANIKRTNQGPRVHDLRFTFITHSFDKYVKTGKDATVFLPILMTYVGHKSIQATEYYLKSTSESLDIVRVATDSYLESGNNHEK